MKSTYILAAVAAMLSTSAIASTTAITTLNGSQGVAAPAGELNPGSSATITSNTSLSSNGSLELIGDRTRVLNGNNYAPSTNYGLASSLVSLTGDYLVLDGGGNTAGTGGIQSPAFRVYIQDGSTRSELIWEAAYNGGYTTGVADSVSSSDLFWQFISGSGPSFIGGTGTYVMHTVSEWGALYSSGAYVSAFGVGNGGGAGNDFHALADNVTLTTRAGSLGYDFQQSAVPEPATWAMMVAGFGLVGGAIRRRKTQLTFA